METPETVVDQEVTPVSEEVQTPEPEETATTAGEEQETPETKEGEEPEAEEKPKGPRKVDAETRIQELTHKTKDFETQLSEERAKREALEQKFASQQQAAPDFFEVDTEKVNQYLGQIADKIEDARLEGNHIAVAHLEAERSRIVGELNENEAKKQKYFESQKEADNRQTTLKAHMENLDNAAEFFRKETNIPEATWNLMGKQFFDECNTNKVLGRKFAETFERQGAIAAVEMAYNHMKEKTAPDTKPAKEAAKDTAAGLTGSTGEAPTGPKSWEDVMKMSPKQRNDFYTNNKKRFDELYSKHMKKQT